MSNGPASREQFQKDFRETIESAAARLRELPPDQDSADSESGKWTRKEIIGHLIDSAANNHQRFVRSQLTDDLVFLGYEQNRWVSVQQYNDESWSDLVELWRAYNLHLLHVISVMSESVLMKPRPQHNLDQIAWQTVAKSDPVTLDYFVRDYVGHLRHHLAQIFDDRR